MESVPCSHVGHIFRSWHPYFIPEDSHGINSARMAEVWMDDYKRLYYMHRQVRYIGTLTMCRLPLELLCPNSHISQEF